MKQFAYKIIISSLLITSVLSGQVYSNNTLNNYQGKRLFTKQLEKCAISTNPQNSTDSAFKLKSDADLDVTADVDVTDDFLFDTTAFNANKKSNCSNILKKGNQQDLKQKIFYNHLWVTNGLE